MKSWTALNINEFILFDMLGTFCGAKYAHYTFTPIIKHI